MIIDPENAMNTYLSWLRERREKYDIDLGDGHLLRFFEGPNGEQRYGAFVMHLAGDGTPCESAASLAGEHPWQVVSWEPLTISPSLLCMKCGDHGFVRDGKWVRA